MKQEYIKLESRIDGHPLDVLMVRPEVTPKAIFQLVHGMSEYKERYLPFMEYLAGMGYVCVIHDHRGHGESVRTKEDYGYFYDNGAVALVEDTNQVSRHIRKEYKDIPFYLLGHSMGSLVVRSYLKKYDRVIDGLIVCGSPSNNPLAKPSIYLAKMNGKLYGDRAKGHWFDKMSFGNFNKNVKDADCAFSWLSENKENVKHYMDSEKCGFVFTMNGFENLFRVMTDVYSKNNWNVTKPELPVLFIAGEEDPCIINPKKFDQAVESVRSRGYNNVSSKLYKGMRHEILNETECKKVYDDIATTLEVWLDRKC